MAILPIDIQTIMAQMNRAGQLQHNAEHAPITQQQNYGHAIENESLVKDREVNQLNQTDNEDKKVNSEEHKKFNSESEERKKKEDKKEFRDREERILLKDPDKGNIIDVKK